MPEIPLFNGGETVKTGAIPQMPLDTQRRPRADFRGIIAGLGELAQRQRGLAEANQQPTLDPNMFNGLDKGYKALAEGIKDVGGFLEKYAEKRQEVVNHRDITYGKAEMEVMISKRQSTQAEISPQDWRRNLDQDVEQWRAAYSKRKDISQYAKDQVLGALDEKMAVLRVQTDASADEAIYKQSQAATDNYVRMKAAAGDKEGVKTAVTEAYIKGVYTLERAADESARADKQIVRNNLMNAAEKEPGRTLYFLNNPDAPDLPEQYKELTPRQREIFHARSELSFQRLNELAAREVRTGLAAGEISTMKDLMALSIVRNQQDPITAQRIVKAVWPMVARPDEGVMRAPELYVEVRAHGMREPRLEGEKEMETQRLLTAVAMLPGPVSDKLSTIMAGIGQELAAPSREISLGLRQILLMQKEGLLDMQDDGLVFEVEDGDDVDVQGEVGKPGTLDPKEHLKAGDLRGVLPVGRVKANTESAWRAYDLMISLDRHATSLGKPMTSAEVQQWIDDNTASERLYAGALAMRKAGARSLMEEGRVPVPWQPV